MQSPLRTVAKKLLATESPWNPKVVAGRAAIAILPGGVLHSVKKAYYARLVTRLPEDFMETDVPLVKHLVSNGDHVVDVGASLGIYTKFLSKLVGPPGKVWSFEPIAETFDYLSNNIRKLGLENVELVNAAVSDNDGQDKMAVPTYRWGTDCFYDARIASAQVYDRHSPPKPSWKTETVRTLTLDSFFSGRNLGISFVKCDANFHELACIRGALATIRRSKPAMLIEIQPDPDDPNTTAYETFALLRAEGYTAFVFKGAQVFLRRPGERSQNYFFLMPAHISDLQSSGLIGTARN